MIQAVMWYLVVHVLMCWLVTCVLKFRTILHRIFTLLVLGFWPFYHLQGFPGSSDGKESTCSAGDLDLIPGSGRPPGEGIGYLVQYSWASLVAQSVKNPPAMWETWVWSLGWEDPLEKGMATQSSILAWRTPWAEEPGRLQSMGSQRVGHDWATLTHSPFKIDI